MGIESYPAFSKDPYSQHRSETLMALEIEDSENVPVFAESLGQAFLNKAKFNVDVPIVIHLSDEL